MEKSRQIGMTWTAAYRAVRQTAARGQRLDCWASSRDELQARLFLDDCRKWAQALELGAEQLEGEGLSIALSGRGAAGTLSLTNGRRIHSLSSNADAQAGKRGTRILDEFALHPDPRKLYSIAYPGITWGGQLEILSTHRGSGNFFNRLVQEAREEGNPKGVSLHRVTLQDAVDQGFLEKLKQKLPPDDPRQAMARDSYLQHVRDGCADDESWLQEYCCVPADDAAAFLPLDLICGSEYEEEDEAQWRMNTADLRRRPGRLYLGVDVGRDHDLTVLWLVEVADGIAWTRQLRCLRAEPFNRQEEVLDGLLSLPGLRRCCIDATGIGRQFAERAQQRWGVNRVEAVTLTALTKEELAYPVRSAFEERSLRLPSLQEVRSDLRAIRRETTSAGNLRFTADRGKNGHADRFWALALALHAARFSDAHRQLHAESVGRAWAGRML